MMDLSQLYMLEMMRKRRLADTVREDAAWDILVETGGATHTILVRCLTGQTANIDWGDGNSTEATATSLTSYAHNYPAGTFTITITGRVYGFIHGAAAADYQRTTTIRNANLPNMISANSMFIDAVNAGIAENCRISSGITDISNAIRGFKGPTIPATMQIPAGITTAVQCFTNSKVTYIPLSIWPTGGFTRAGTINLESLFSYSTTIVGSIAPSQILWDSGKTFKVNRNTFNPSNATGWLNYAAAYTDPVSGITYSKIPYAWGGAAD